MQIGGTATLSGIKLRIEAQKSDCRTVGRTCRVRLSSAKYAPPMISRKVTLGKSDLRRLRARIDVPEPQFQEQQIPKPIRLICPARHVFID